MANVLVELGSPRLYLGAGPTGIVQSVLSFVDSTENPLVGITGSLDQFSDAEQRAIAYLRALSAKRRRRLTTHVAAVMRGIDPGGLGDEKRLQALGQQIRLGLFELGKKKKKKGFGGMFKKVTKLAMSPQMLKLAGVAAIFIPGVGPLAAAGIAAAANMAAQRIEAAKAAKAQAAAKKRMQAEAVAYNTALAQSVGTAQAQAGAASLASAMPPDVQQAASAMVPGIYDEIQAAGPQEVLASSIKGAGQAIALNRTAVGAGMEGGVLGPEGSELDKLMQSNPAFKSAIEQGMDDLKNGAAVTGDLGTVETALDRGEPSSFPWIPVAIGTVVVTGVGYYLAAY